MKKIFISIVVMALLAGCGASKQGEDKVIHIGASVTPQAEIIKEIIPVLEKDGYKVELTEFTDYIKPNQALLDGEIDANFFQHKPFLDDWAAKAGASDKVTSFPGLIFAPIGLYSTKHTSLMEVADGQVIAVPNDPTNEGRALKLLEDHGIISLKKGVDAKTTLDIATYHKNVKIIEMAAETCATSIDDVDYAVVNNNNAQNAKILDKVIVTESKESDAAKTYGNVIAVQTKHKDDEKIKALNQALNTEAVKQFIEEKYKGSVIPLVPYK